MPADFDLTTPDGVAALMRSSNNSGEWNANCDAVKAANGGYPEFWYKTIILSGLTQDVADKWGDPTAFDLKITAYSPK